MVKVGWLRQTWARISILFVSQDNSLCTGQWGKRRETRGLTSLMLVNANECDLASGNLQHKWLDAARRNFRYISRSFQLRSLGFSARLVISSPRGCRTSGVRLGSSDEMVLSWLLFSSLLGITHPLSPEDFSSRPASSDRPGTWTLHGVSRAGRQPGMCPLHVWTHPGLAWAPLNFAAHKSSFDRVQNRPGNYSRLLFKPQMLSILTFNFRVI